LLLVLVLFGPVLIKPVEQNLELFFVGVGGLAAAIAGQLDTELLRDALTAPIAITIAVLIFGTVVRLARPALDRIIQRAITIAAPRWIYFVLVIVLGLLASFITAVIAALILVEAIALLRLDRNSEVAAVVLACFAIGLGAALTPVGEPLSTVAVAALKVDFWYLARLVGPFVMVGIALCGTISLFLPAHYGHSLRVDAHIDSWREIFVRALKIYLFVAGLMALSRGFRPLISQYISNLPHKGLFWINSISAIVDNATLAAAEIGPSLSPAQQRSILVALLISGGMLIPGNIPNIVAAGRLGITSREWARVGLPAGLTLLLIGFLFVAWAG
jgi:predicted cation transporter